MRNILLHLRLPFSVFLLPIFLFALSQVSVAAHPGGLSRAWWAFVLIHFLLYPASNAYNSFYDKDEGSIGLLESPPPVSTGLLYTAWGMDLVAIIMAILAGLGFPFILYLIIYGSISKLYSHPAVRLKKYPLLSWIIVGLFQGAFTYLATVQVIGQNSLPELLTSRHVLPALICTSNLWAVYPLTQIYQHEEDARRGDLTYSRLLGLNGTFLNAAVFFCLSFAGFLYYFLHFGVVGHLVTLALCMGPVMVYFVYWWVRVRRDQREASFQQTMRMNLLAGLGLNLFFGILCFYSL